MNKLRLLLSRLGILAPVGQWEADAFRYLMKRLTPSGSWEWREMTKAEFEEEMRGRAW